jgi:hypothetical protein
MLSPYGDMVYCAPGVFTRLTPLSSVEVSLPTDLPEATVLGIEDALWSPYDPDKVMLRVLSMVDTGKASGARVPLWNLYAYKIANGVATRVTPLSAGKFGAKSLALYQWKGSEGLDTLLIGYRQTERADDSGFYGLYLPAKNQLVPVDYVDIPNTVIGRSHDSQYVVTVVTDNKWIPPFYLNGAEIGLTYPVEEGRAYFSPSGHTFALLVRQVGLGSDDDFRYPQLWIYDVNDVSAPRSRINFQKLHCTYSFWGINPEFITDTTIAVSMHKDGDISSPLWEIGLDGRIIRQLTFLPTSSVSRAGQRGAALSYSSSGGLITVKLPSASIDRKIRIVNSVGQQVLASVLPLGSTSISLDFSRQPSGAYFCMIEGETEPAKFTIER